MTGDDARRGTLREHGEADRGIYFGRHPKRPAGAGVPVRIAREARAIRLRDLAGDTVEAFGDTTKFWLAPASTEPETLAAAGTAAPLSIDRSATVAAAERAHTADQDALLTSYRLTAHAISTAGVTPAPVRQTWIEAGSPARFLYCDRGIDPSQPILATTRDGFRICDARTGRPLAHYASPVRMWIAPAPAPAAGAGSAVIIVGCGAAKASGRLPAGGKYVGSFHLAARRAAAAIAGRSGGQVLILSARYGLITLDTEVDDYDVSIGDPDAVTPGRITVQAAALHITTAAVTVLAARRYADLVSAVWPDADRPLDGARGIGDQLARLEAIAQQGGDGMRCGQQPVDGPA